MSEKILIVDDEVEIADLIEVYLKNENYTVFKFYTATEALECINTTMLDLAILCFPTSTGLPYAKRLENAILTLSSC